MDDTSLKTQLLVIGAGPGGYAAAFYAADCGLDVTLVDTEENPGGVCLFKGCIPSKALLHAAKIITEARDAAAIGIQFPEPQIDIAKVREWKNSVVARLTGGLGQLSKQRKVRFIRGRARFVDARRIEVGQADGPDLRVEFENAIIATGSVPVTLPFAPQTPNIWDSTAALALENVPQKLLVIGGGYIGLELGSVYAALGSQVTVVEMTPSLLPGVDGDLVRVLQKTLAPRFSAVKVNTKVTAIDDTGSGVKAGFEDAQGGKSEDTFDKVFIAIGRKPSAAGLETGKASVELTDQGFIRVDPRRRTSTPNIYAIGDIAGNPMLAHKASHEGRVAVDAILGKKTVFAPRAIPAVVFTDPEIAWCGLTETEAAAQGRDVKVCKFPWAASGRAVTLNRIDGLTKLILEPGTGRILGVALAGPGAGEMIAEGILAVEMGAVAEDLALSIHAHPTLSETVMEAAELFAGTCTHIYRPNKT